MKIVLLYHSVISDWNHGGAHFLRGIATEMIRRGHQVTILEPANGWSLSHLVAERGQGVYRDFERHFPDLIPFFYDPAEPELDVYLKRADLVMVHDWTDHAVVRLLGIKKADYHYRLLFHDTHHRALSDPAAMEHYDLSAYDGVLAHGEKIRDRYLEKGWAKNAWTWQHAADTRVFYTLPKGRKEGDAVWIGNWGEELVEYLVRPVRDLSLSAAVYGTGYPPEAIRMLKQAGIRYGGYLPSVEMPAVFSRYHFTLHLPRRLTPEPSPDIPAIRPFEAMACGIPLLSAPLPEEDTVLEQEKDFLVAFNGDEMKRHMLRLRKDKLLCNRLQRNAWCKVQKGHCCRHRIEELMWILRGLDAPGDLNAESWPLDRPVEEIIVPEMAATA